MRHAATDVAVPYANRREAWISAQRMHPCPGRREALVRHLAPEGVESSLWFIETGVVEPGFDLV